MAAIRSGNGGKDMVERGQLGSNQSDMRAYNERLVLSMVRRNGAMSKTEIAKATSLSAQTVSVIMRGLEADGLLVRGEPIRGKVGQPSVPMSLAPDGAFFFGLKLGRRNADLVLIDFLGNILSKTLTSYPYPTPDGTIEFAKRAIDELVVGLPENHTERLAGLGIAMPFGLWGWAETIGAPRSVMEAWKERDIREDIAALYDFPVYLQNDATAACGAELVFGKSVHKGDFLYFFIGSFIGGGIVLDGSLYPGRTGNAGALGSMPVPDGKGGICQLLDVASLILLEKRMKEEGLATDILWQSVDSWGIDEKLLSGWVEEASRGIAYGIFSAASVIDFEKVVIDGWLPAEVREQIVVATRKYLAELNTVGIAKAEIHAGSVGGFARALGAASLPLFERFLVHYNLFDNIGMHL